MDEIVNKLLLAGDTFMPEKHLKEPGFTYSACGPFKKKKGNTSYIYKNELDKACFQHEMAYGDFKDLARRTASDKILRDKPFNIAKNPKYDGYQRGLASMIYNFFDKKGVVLLLLILILIMIIIIIVIIIIIIKLNKICN